jgi:hypothetical protein
VAAAALALGGCGGGGSGNDDSDTPASSGSIIDCFTANKTVNFSVVVPNAPINSVVATRSTTGPMIYNGKAVTGQTLFYSNGSPFTESNYWTVTSNGVTMIATVLSNGTVAPDGTFYPYNMNPGQTATDSSNDVTVFIGFETVSLAGKTFINTCHIRGVDSRGISAEGWYAPGYGLIKQTGSNGTFQYNGSL